MRALLDHLHASFQERKGCGELDSGVGTVRAKLIPSFERAAQRADHEAA